MRLTARGMMVAVALAVLWGGCLRAVWARGERFRAMADGYLDLASRISDANRGRGTPAGDRASRLYRKYDRAAGYPFLPVAPGAPEPGRPRLWTTSKSAAMRVDVEVAEDRASPSQSGDGKQHAHRTPLRRSLLHRPSGPVASTGPGAPRRIPRPHISAVMDEDTAGARASGSTGGARRHGPSDRRCGPRLDHGPANGLSGKIESLRRLATPSN